MTSHRAPGPDERDAPARVDLDRPTTGAGPQWGMQSGDLNATLLAWPPGGGVAEHRNDERDVLLVLLEGSMLVRVDGIEQPLSKHELLLLPRGCTRALTAGAGGARYLSIHRRRDPLLPVRRLPSRDGAAVRLRESGGG